jgi:S1-C subfamily serine protease
MVLLMAEASDGGGNSMKMPARPNGYVCFFTPDRALVQRRARQLSALVLSAALLGACGGNQPASPTKTPVLTATATAIATLTPEPPTATPIPADWKESVVQIVVAGTFVEPTIGRDLQVSSGSGVIIDKSGLVITNNHVVGGASLVRIRIPGEKEPRNGRVIAISECSDLALVQIEGNGSFHAIEWFNGPINSELLVRKGGYPGDASTVNVQEGIISQVGISMQTNWASVASAFAHSAKILPGDSGGVLVAQEDGRWKVVAINFANNNANDQNYAIGRDDVRAFIDAVQAKISPSTVVLEGAIGINGVAVRAESDGKVLSGIWVRAVIAGSPADTALLKPGDLILSMNELALARDETMQIYCEFVHNRATAPLNIMVLRPTTGELLEGQINGRELKPTPKPTPEPTVAPTGIITTFTEEQATSLRKAHNALVGKYRKLLFETFDRGIPTRRNWPEGDQSQRLLNNRYQMALSEPNAATWEAWNVQNSTLGDSYTLELSVRFPSLSPTAQAGLAFDIQGDRNQKLFYTMGSDGTWNIYRDNTKIAEGSTPSNFKINPDTDYSLWITRTPKGTIFFFNQVVVAFMSESPYRGGQIGVVGRSGENTPALVVVDDLVVRAP